MSEKEFRFYLKSGQILAQALRLAEKIVKPGKKLLEIAETIESYIRDAGATPAFPVNISINEIAAHYSPIIDDELTIPPKSIVKIDVGVSLKGYLSDAARTFVFDNKWKNMAEVAKNAFYNAIKIIRPNTTVYKVGEIIGKTITSAGFKPIVNLSGHSMAHYSLHDGIYIPNFSVPLEQREKKQRFLADHVYAIEPFVTTGQGRVIGGNEITILRLVRYKKKGFLPTQYEEIYTYIRDHFKTLPFSPRWLNNAKFREEKIYEALEYLLERSIIHGYEVLVEASKKPVTQFENTIFLKKEGPIVITETSKK